MCAIARSNVGVTPRTHRLPSVVAMSTSTIERQTTERPTSTWVCPNCRTETDTARKRCTDCKTSRY
jgi:hypothetical protein